MRKSNVSSANLGLVDESDVFRRKDNLKFFESALQRLASDDAAVLAVLVGSRDLPGDLVRRAQAILRWDLAPSYWSHCFVLGSGSATTKLARLGIHEVAMHPRNRHFPRPSANGLNEGATLGLYRDPRLDANVAVLRVRRTIAATDAMGHGQSVERLRSIAADGNTDRQRFDYWNSIAVWQQYIWSNGERPNPLRQGVPIPAAAHLDATCEGIGLDIVPSADERNCAPEHIWQAAKWWYAQSQGSTSLDGFVLDGFYVIRDPGASRLDDNTKLRID